MGRPWWYYVVLAAVVLAPVLLGWLYRPGGYLNGPTSFDRRGAANRRPRG